MLVICQFPLIDFRRFFNGTDRLTRPNWLRLQPTGEYIRNWGSIPPSGAGGVGCWLGDERRCQADGALRIPPTPESRTLLHDYGGRLLFRTFHFDGYAAGKFEIGMDFRRRVPESVPVAEVIRLLWTLPVEVIDPLTLEPVRCSLGDAGKLLAASYLVNTTQPDSLPLPEDSGWWVQHGGSVVVVELQANEERSVGLDAVRSIAGVDRFPARSVHKFGDGDAYTPLWVLRKAAADRGKDSACRTVSINLLNVHAAQTAMRLVLHRFGELSLPATDRRRTILLEYLNRETTRIAQWERATAMPVVAISNSLGDSAGEKERQLLLKVAATLTEAATPFLRNLNNKVVEAVTAQKVRKQGKRMILFLMSSPVDQPPLELAVEIREIKSKLRQAQYRDLFSVEVQLAARVEDMWDAVLDSKPQIVHFACHGTDDAILLEDDEGHAKPVTGQALASYFAQFPTLECVVLNACYSETQASEIVKNVDYVIGMQNKAPDKGAHLFAVRLYGGIGAGKAYAEAFDLALTYLRLEGLDQVVRPVLKVRGA